MSRQIGRSLPGYGVAIIVTSATTAVIAGLDRIIHIPNASLLYLPGILIIAVYFGTLPSLLAAALATVELDFFLLRPAFTLTIDRVQDIVALTVFVLVALLSGPLAAGARAREQAARRQAAESATLYELGQTLVSGEDVGEILDAITRRVVEIFDLTLCAIFVRGPDGELELAAETSPVRVRRDRASRAVASWVLEHDDRVGPFSPERDGPGAEASQFIYIPLKTTERVVGVMEVGPKRSGGTLDANEYGLVVSFAAQAALVLLRAQAQDERRRLRALEENDRLKSGLLSAISHDLRTPLASIKASATTLLLQDTPWTRDEGRELLTAIDHEADRLNRLVGNLLDLSRIQAGALQPVLDWYEVDEVIDDVLPRLRRLVGDRPFTSSVQPDIPPVRLDFTRIEELLVNLVENAVKYTPPGSPIALRVRHDAGGLSMAVEDHGPGVPEGQRQRIFDSFYRGRRHTDRHPGSGLGLAICRGIAEAHGGTVSVETTPGGGATFVLHLPPSSVHQSSHQSVHQDVGGGTSPHAGENV